MGIAEIAVRVSERNAKAAERGIELAQENTICVQRASVVLRGGSVQLDQGEQAGFGLIFVNAGNTPANEVEVSSKAEVRARTDIPVPNIDCCVWLGGSTLGPRETLSNYAETAEPVSYEQIALMDDVGTLGLFAWGVVRYKDLFGKTRYTRFCVAWSPGTPNFGPCMVGNEAQ